MRLKPPAWSWTGPSWPPTIASLHARLKRLGVELRPHGKTAKNHDVLRMALAGQTGGITVSTLKEAEYHFAHGVVDMIYAVGIAPVKMDRLTALIAKGAQVSVILDSMAQARFVDDAARGHGLYDEVGKVFDSEIGPPRQFRDGH
jgi:D-serine deaminase-like pyridoxal phosphate-dependent protein